MAVVCFEAELSVLAARVAAMVTVAANAKPLALMAKATAVEANRRQRMRRERRRQWRRSAQSLGDEWRRAAHVERKVDAQLPGRHCSTL